MGHRSHQGGSWRTTRQPSIHHAGTWRSAAAAWIRKGATWVKWWPDVPYRGGPYIYGAIASCGPNICRFDGSLWVSVGGGRPGDVKTIALADDGAIMASYLYYNPNHRFALWNGSTWSAPFGNGTYDFYSGSAAKIVVSNQEYYGTREYYVLHPSSAFEFGSAEIHRMLVGYNAFQYNVLSIPVDGYYADIKDFSVIGSSVQENNRGYAFGGSGIWPYYTMRTAFDPVSSGGANGPMSGTPTTPTCTDRQLDGRVWLAGTNTYPNSFVHHDGGGDDTWTRVGTATGFNGLISKVLALPDGRAWAIGSFTAVDGVSASGIAEWNGSAWGPCGAGIANPVGLAYHQDKLWILAGASLTTRSVYTWDGATLALHSNWTGETIRGIA